MREPWVRCRCPFSKSPRTIKGAAHTIVIETSERSGSIDIPMILRGDLFMYVAYIHVVRGNWFISEIGAHY
jgi:hypothetical protein